MTQVNLYRADQEPQVFKPGTVLACHGDSFVSNSIRFGQRLRIEKKYCWANHIACVMTPEGTVMEMLADGAELSNASVKYKSCDYVVIDPGLDADDTQRACAVWEQIWATHTGYGFLEIASVSMSLMTGTHLRLMTQGKLICSGAAAVGLAATKADIPLAWRQDPAFVMPAEFMRHWNVLPPASATKGS